MGKNFKMPYSIIRTGDNKIYPYSAKRVPVLFLFEVLLFILRIKIFFFRALWCHGHHRH